MKDGSICSKCNHRAYCAMGDEQNGDNVAIKGCYLYSEQKVKTNADRIRAMTDEELTNWITYLHCPHYEDDDYACDDCEACWREWLKQECEA